MSHKRWQHSGACKALDNRTRSAAESWRTLYVVNHERLHQALGYQTPAAVYH